MRGNSRSRLTSRCLTALFTVCAATAVLSSCGSGASAKSSQAGLVKGRNGVDTTPVAHRKPAPDISGRTTTVNNLSIEDHKGEVIVLNIWGSWCGPCIAEAPNFAEVAKET
ncbi:TlpA family protein disulfide reductase [Streptomyces purpurogeneiscleroticus]|uniref:TlpA family protein disulfide reductase n=1 Tax=Streptomyces purpurogeneiscleroticus TaxID=68259 RepID=UPI0027E037EC|nr:TlpA disulfide reductase family protein [Streptomyces purpurogeneiscleroticus]